MPSRITLGSSWFSSLGGPDGGLQHQRIKFGTGVAGTSAKEGKIVTVDDTEEVKLARGDMWSASFFRSFRVFGVFDSDSFAEAKP